MESSGPEVRARWEDKETASEERMWVERTDVGKPWSNCSRESEARPPVNNTEVGP